VQKPVTRALHFEINLMTELGDAWQGAILDVGSIPTTSTISNNLF